MAYPSDDKSDELNVPVIDGSGLLLEEEDYWLGLLRSRNKSYIIIDGFEVRNSNESLVVLSNGDGIIIRNCKVHHCPEPRAAIYIGHSSHCIVENCEIHDSGWNGINLESTENCVVRYNYCHHNNFHNGINIFPCTTEEQEMFSGNDVMFNLVENNLNGIYMRYQDKNKIIGNVIYNNNNGIELTYQPGERKSYDAYTEIYNNTIANNHNNGIASYSAKYCTIKNNIFAYNDKQNDLRVSYPEGYSVDYNLYYDSVSFLWGGNGYRSLSAFHKDNESQEAHGIQEDPIFENKLQHDYALQATSRAINAGENLPSVTIDIVDTPRPQEGQMDIGAYEYEYIEFYEKRDLKRPESRIQQFMGGHNLQG